MKETNTLQELARKRSSAKDYCVHVPRPAHSHDRELTLLGDLILPQHHFCVPRRPAARTRLLQLFVAQRHAEAMVRSSGAATARRTAPLRLGFAGPEAIPMICSSRRRVSPKQNRAGLKLLSHSTSCRSPELLVLACSRITSPGSPKWPAGSPWQPASPGFLDFQKPKL